MCVHTSGKLGDILWKNNNASTASGKELAGLKNKKMKNMIMMTQKSQNRIRANLFVGNWGHVGSLGHMYS